MQKKTFLKALTKKAKPTKVLDNRYKQFQRRMSRHWLNAASDEIEETLVFVQLVIILGIVVNY